MDSEKKAIELQYQVRRNAKEYHNSMKDLFSWEKEIKSKEKALQNAPAPTINKDNTPIRSHVKKSSSSNSEEPKFDKNSPSGSAASTPTEKQDLPVDVLAQQHKKANDIKDRGNTYVKQADYDRAIEAYTEAIGVYPNDSVYFINRALCYLKLERYHSCVEDCEAAIALDKLCVKAYYRRMQANESLGNNMEALKDCTTVLAINPKNVEAKQSLKRINDRLRKNATKSGPNFNPARDDLIDIQPFDKPAYRRSKQPMRRVPVVDIVSPRLSQDESNQLRISDDEIDKIFNSNCGPFQEVKKEKSTLSKMKSSLGNENNLDVKEQKIEQAVAQSETVISSIKLPQKPLEPQPQDNSKLEMTDESKKSSEKTVKSALTPEIIKSQNKNKETKSSEETVKHVPQKKPKPKDSEQIIIAEKNNIEAVKPVAEPEPDLKPGSLSSVKRVPATPEGTAQFYITWKELSPSQKYHYLKSIEIPNLCKILGAGFDSDTFTDLLSTLQDFFVPNKEPTTAAVLLEISKHDEFTILSMLMSQSEKKMVASVMDGIKKFPKTNPDLLDKLSKAYNLI